MSVAWAVTVVVSVLKSVVSVATLVVRLDCPVDNPWIFVVFVVTELVRFVIAVAWLFVVVVNVETSVVSVAIFDVFVEFEVSNWVIWVAIDSPSATWADATDKRLALSPVKACSVNSRTFLLCSV